MLKLKTMRECENQFNKHFSECGNMTCKSKESDPFVKYDIQCIEMEELNSSQVEVEQIKDELACHSCDSDDDHFEFTEDSDDSVSSNLDRIQEKINDISNLKNDNDVRRESKRMLERLMMMGAFIEQPEMKTIEEHKFDES